MNVDRLIRLARALALAAAVAVLAVPAVAFGGPDVAMRASGRCTMAMPAVRATVEVEIVSAADFCELVSQALAGDVFRSPVLVTPGLLWHYADATLSCRLRYGTTRSQVTIRNSAAACRWFTRLAAEWRAQTSTTAYAVWRDVARGGAG